MSLVVISIKLSRFRYIIYCPLPSPACIYHFFPLTLFVGSSLQCLFVSFLFPFHSSEVLYVRTMRNRLGRLSLSHLGTINCLKWCTNHLP